MRVEWQSAGEAEAAAARALPHAVRWTFGGAVAICVAAAGWLVWRTAILQPYSDMFDWMERYYRFQADGDVLRYLWAPHNFHHLVATFAVLWLDVRAFGASGYLFLATGAVAWAASAAVLAVFGGQAAGAGLRLIGAGGAAALALMGCDALDASADINTTYVYALAAAMGAIAVWERRVPTAGSRLAALGLAGLAGLGSAAGLAVWPALLVAAWRRGERRWALAVLASAAGVSVLYLLGQASLSPAGEAASVSPLSRLAAALALAINYLGLPWVRGLPQLGWLIGAGVLAAGLAALVAALRSPGRLPRIAAALIVFSLATAAMAAIARNGVVDASLVPVRYAAFLVPLHVGVWIVVLPALRRAWLARPRAMEAVAVGAAVLMLAHQGVMAVYAIRTADENRAVIDAFRAGARTPQMLVTIYPDLGKAAALSARMRREGLYQRELRAGAL